MTNWFVWLLVTRVTQPGSDSLKARHLVITSFARAQTFDRCVVLNTLVLSQATALSILQPIHVAEPHS